jgi:hypothetical protein
MTPVLEFPELVVPVEVEEVLEVPVVVPVDPEVDVVVELVAPPPPTT